MMEGFILNIIFDLGGVVVTWNPDDLVKHVFTDPDVRKAARRHILDHNDWLELDRGVLPKEEAIKRGTTRSGLPESDVERLINAVPTFLKPIKDSVYLIQELKNNGHHLFALSNLHLESIDHLEKEYSFLDMFEGKVISCRIKKVKPESEIYEYIIKTYNLDVNDTVFIDDVSLNLETASMLGINTIHFRNIQQCRRELTDLGCFVK